MVDRRLVLRVYKERFRHYPVRLEKFSKYTYHIISIPLIKATGSIRIPVVTLI